MTQRVCLILSLYILVFLAMVINIGLLLTNKPLNLCYTYVLGVFTKIGGGKRLFLVIFQKLKHFTLI